jgi:hypothetical protein
MRQNTQMKLTIWSPEFLQSLWRWLTTPHASFQIIPQMFDWVQILWHRQPGEHCCRAEELPYVGSLRAARVVSKSHSCIEWRLGCRGCAQVEFFRRRYPTSSHFLHRNCRPQWSSSLRTSHSGVFRHVYGHLFCSMNLDSSLKQTRLQLSGPIPLLCCTIGPL